MNSPDALFREAAPLQADGIQSISMSIPRGYGFGKGQNIFGDCRPAAYVGVRSDAYELVNRAQSADDSPLFDNDVAAKGCAVHQHDMISDNGIMSDVRVRHDESVIADSRQTAALNRATGQGDGFANLVMVANFKACRFSLVGYVLRRHSDGGKWKE